MLHGYLPALLQGAGLSLAVAFGALALALLLGMAGALAKLSRSLLARTVAQAYTTLIRAVPDLVLMLLVFYGGQMGVNALSEQLGYGYIDIDPYVAGVATIGFVFAAYVTEVLRGAILAVPAGQREAALAIGFSRIQVLWRIVGPQALRHALPRLSNTWLVMIKATAIVSVIGLSDLMSRAAQAAGATREPFLFYLAVGIVYLGFTSVSERWARSSCSTAWPRARCGWTWKRPAWTC